MVNMIRKWIRAKTNLLTLANPTPGPGACCSSKHPEQCRNSCHCISANTKALLERGPTTTHTWMMWEEEIQKFSFATVKAIFSSRSPELCLRGTFFPNIIASSTESPLAQGIQFWAPSWLSPTGTFSLYCAPPIAFTWIIIFVKLLL